MERRDYGTVQIISVLIFLILYKHLLFGVYGRFAYVHVILRPEAGDVSPRTEITGGLKLPCRCWRPNSGPLEEQSAS